MQVPKTSQKRLRNALLATPPEERVKATMIGIKIAKLKSLRQKIQALTLLSHVKQNPKSEASKRE